MKIMSQPFSPKLNKVRQFIKQEFQSSDPYDYFWSGHVALVEKFAQQLLEKYPEANSEVVLLSVWFHDIGRAYDHHQDHESWGAKFAQDYLTKENFPQEVIDQVYHSCSTHKVQNNQPQTLEAKILATADALSHFDQGSYLRIWLAWGRQMDDYDKMRAKLKEKLERDFSEKIFFPEIKEAVCPQYEAWIKILEEVQL